ncbi:hypothetical protein SEUCBS140593_006431 [Sporothrix eucalyptigena]|uniref:N-acetyltransferase ESCO zinc-finger domain-containing protein n=1 Tax=Sporothrix eucalyptigena TaxID=1812306 RepID=A0ABP0C4V0_9PEZI
MRYMTPDTPGMRSLESPITRRMEKSEEVKTMTVTAVPSKMETTTPSATPTPTPSPTKAPDAVAAGKPARRAIRTYGRKRPLLEDTSKGNSASLPPTASHSAKCQKTTEAPRTITTTQAHSDTRDIDLDEVSRQLQKEAEEAERRNQRPKTPRKPSSRKPNPPPRKVGGSSRELGIMRYFQPAAPRSAAAVPPPSLPDPPCSPTESISSMSSLSSCPSPTSSMGSFFSRASSVVSSPSAKSSCSADGIAANDPEDASSPPASPLWKTSEQRPRQKRRLTIRPDGQLATTTTENSAAQSPKEEEEGQEGEAKDAPAATSRSNFTGMMVASSSRMRLQLGLSKTGSATATTGKKRKKMAGPATVQTTLSLAISGGDSASVKECKECNILYNPLHEKDAKFHARYHASVCRKKQE